MLNRSIVWVAVLSLLSIPTIAQAEPSEPLPAVFLDCDYCDSSYLRRAIPFVNWVRDRQDALVHVQVITQGTAGGGREYSLDFIGRQTFAGNQRCLKGVLPPQATNDEERQKLANLLKIGLLPYISSPQVLEQLTLVYAGTDSGVSSSPAPTKDPWDSWVFEIEGDGWLDKEASQSSYEIDGEFSARRVTEAWRFQTYIWGEYEQDRFEQGDRSISSSTHEQNLWGQLVKSIGPHWSAGLRIRGFSNTFDNIDLGWQLSPALEYSYYDYAESERRSLTFAYFVGHRYHNYTKRTIYDQVTEPLFNQSLDIDLRLTRPWGSSRVSLEASHFFHNLKRYRVELYGRLSLRLFKGVSLYVNGSFDRINDQLSLARGDATLEEVLLQRRNLATDYEVDAGIGLSYTFGSIYNNVVNTRL